MVLSSVCTKEQHPHWRFAPQLGLIDSYRVDVVKVRYTQRPERRYAVCRSQYPLASRPLNS